MALGLIWLAIGGAILYVFAWWGGAADLRVFCLVWLCACPAAAGFYSGWKSGKRGFFTGARAMLIYALVVGSGWWWLFPGLWDAGLWLKAALYALTVGALCGGLAVGLKQTKPPPPAPPAEDRQET